MTEKLRVALLLDDFVVSHWAYVMLEQVQQSDYAQIELLVINDSSNEPVNEGGYFNKLKQRWRDLPSIATRKLAEQLQSRFLERIPDDPDAFDTKDLSELLNGASVVHVKPRQTKWSDYIVDDDLDRIETFNIDVMLRLGFRILRGGILTSAKYGIWSYHHGDNQINRGGPPGFWEVMQSWPETGSVLQILSEDLDNGDVLYRSYSNTYQYSVNHNNNGFYWKSVAFIPRKLKQLYELGDEAFFAELEAENAHPSFYSRPLYKAPSSSHLLKLVIRKLWHKCQFMLHQYWYLDQWFLLFQFSDDQSSSFWRFKKIIPPKDRFWADPHVIHHQDKYHVFVEEYLYQTHKGHISVISIDKQGNYSTATPVLERPYHLSYPFVFQWNDDFYMIPETASKRRIELYKCSRFPDQWEFQMNLMENVQAVDATLHHQDDKWWMFVNIAEYRGAETWEELFIFYADELQTQDWQAHAKNPVISDVKRARPAGKLFVRNGRLYRPSQNCSPRYGYGFSINEVQVLNEQQYAEQAIAEIKPEWEDNLLATHSFCHQQGITVIDAQMRRRRLFE